MSFFGDAFDFIGNAISGSGASADSGGGIFGGLLGGIIHAGASAFASSQKDDSIQQYKPNMPSPSTLGTTSMSNAGPVSFKTAEDVQTFYDDWLGRMAEFRRLERITK